MKRINEYSTHAMLFVSSSYFVFSTDMKYNFNKINTLNQGTSYDYGSVMQYHKYAQLVLTDLCVVTAMQGPFKQLVVSKCSSAQVIKY